MARIVFSFRTVLRVTAHSTAHGERHRLPSRGAAPASERSRTGLAGQLSRAAEQTVEHERALHVAMQVVLGGEADAAEHLLAVLGRGQRGLPGRRLGQQRRQVVVVRPANSVASAPSMATRVSASRCRTAWNDAMGLPNWTRSTACWRASASIARPNPTSHQPSARRALRQRYRPRRRRCSGRAVRDPSPIACRRCAPRPPRRRRCRAAGVVPPGSRPAAASTTSLRTERGRRSRRAGGRPERYRLRRDLGRASRASRVRPAPRRARRRTPPRMVLRFRPASRPASRVRVVHVHSFPRSSSRRAMMLRWISAVPP